MEKLAKGKWWLPNKPEKQFKGELKFNQSEGGTLLLSDTFDSLWDFPRDKQDFLLLGNLTDATKTIDVSVIISLMTKYQEKNDSEGSNVTVTLKPKFVFLGIHIEDQNHIEFDKVFLNFSNIDHWISPIHDLIPESDNGWAYRSPWISINQDCKIQITSHPKTRKEGSKRVRENNIKFIVESLEDKSFENYLGLEGKVRDFLNFVINKGVVLESFQGLYREGSSSIPFTLLFHSLVTEKMHKVTVKSPYLFSYVDVSHRFEDILKRWFGLYAENEIIMDLYFGVIYNTQSYLSNNFLMLFTALEVYHVVFLDKYSEKKREKEVFGNNLIRKVEEFDLLKNERDKLKDIINNFGKHLSSKERIEEIYDKFSDFLPSLSSKIETRSKFIRRIVDFRNDLTHGNKPFTEFDNETLFWQFKNLQLILQLCILSRIGFDREQIKKIYLLDKMAKTN